MSSLLPTKKSMHTSYFHIGHGKHTQLSFDVNIKKLTSGSMDAIIRSYHSSSHLNKVDEHGINLDIGDMNDNEFITSSSLLYNGVQMNKFKENSELSSVVSEKINWQEKIPGPNSYIRHHRKRSTRDKEKDYSRILSSCIPEERIGELIDKSDGVIVDGTLKHQSVLQSFP